MLQDGRRHKKKRTDWIQFQWQNERKTEAMALMQKQHTFKKWNECLNQIEEEIKTTNRQDQ